MAFYFHLNRKDYWMAWMEGRKEIVEGVDFGP